MATRVVLKMARHGGSVPETNRPIECHVSILTDEIHYQLLKMLKQNPNLTQRELASELGISLGKTNYCLKAMIERGWVKVDNFKRNKNKMNYAYLLTPRGLEEKARVTLRFLKRKQEEHDALIRELEELRKEAALLSVAGEYE